MNLAKEDVPFGTYEMKDKKRYQNALDRIATAKDMAIYMLIGCVAILLCVLWYGLVGIGRWIPAAISLLMYFQININQLRIFFHKPTSIHNINLLLFSAKMGFSFIG